MKKKTTTKTTAAPAVTTTKPSMAFETRVIEIHRRLISIAAAAMGADHDCSYAYFDADELYEVIAHQASEALAFLEPIRHAPGEVACWTPDDADEGGDE